MSIDDGLLELGLVLPAVPKMPAGVATTFSWVRILGDRVLVSGHGPQDPDGSPAGPFGRVPDQLAAYGTGDQVREQLRPWDRAADIVTILLPPGMPWHNIEATLQAAAPSARPGRAQRDISTTAVGQATPTGDGRK